MFARSPLLIASLCLAPLVAVTSCAEDFPSRSDFIAEAKAQIPTTLSDQLADAKIDPAVANTLIEDHLGCIYDAISSDEGLVEQAVSEPGSTSTQSEIADMAPECTERVNKAILDAISTSDQ